MITFAAFVLTILGCVNWLLIGMLQYDFIAGLFGFQASMFSRIVYIIFGIAAAYLCVRVIVNKGNFKVWEKRKKKQTSQNSVSNAQNASQPSYVNIEASQEFPQNDSQKTKNSDKKRKKKKWWQFWRRGKTKKKKNKTKSSIDIQIPDQLPQNSQKETEETSCQQTEKNSIPVDVSLNTASQQSSKDSTFLNSQSANLFDEHLKN